MPDYDDFSDLNDMEPDWMNADSDIGSPVPDGTYQCRIEKMELTRTKDSHKPMVRWELEILGPTHTGRRLFDNQVVWGDTPEERTKRLSFIKSRLHMLGCDPVNLRDLADDHVRAQVLDVCVEVRQKTSEVKGKEYINLYFVKRLDLILDAPGAAGRGF